MVHIRMRGGYHMRLGIRVWVLGNMLGNAYEGGYWLGRWAVDMTPQSYSCNIALVTG